MHVCELCLVTSIESAQSLIVEMFNGHKNKLLLKQCVPYLNISKVLHICSSVRFCLGP